MDVCVDFFLLFERRLYDNWTVMFVMVFISWPRFLEVVVYVILFRLVVTFVGVGYP